MTRPKPERVDALLVRRGLAASRQRARELIEQGRVLVDGVPVERPAAQVTPDRAVTLTGEDFPWVGRGALKLIAGLDALGVDPSGLVCADLGSSTGGFTQVLLHRGAVRVYAIDVGKGQLAWSLRQDPRVVVMEGLNVRYLEGLPEPVDLVVGDLSFISLGLVLPAIARILRPGGTALVLVKPQFEVGPEHVGKGGLVKDPVARERAIAEVRDAAIRLGFLARGGLDCPVPGARAGNVEHFLLLAAPGRA